MSRHKQNLIKINNTLPYSEYLELECELRKIKNLHNTSHLQIHTILTCNEEVRCILYKISCRTCIPFHPIVSSQNHISYNEAKNEFLELIKLFT